MFSERRIQSNRNSLCCCYKHKKNEKNESGTDLQGNEKQPTKGGNDNLDVPPQLKKQISIIDGEARDISHHGYVGKILNIIVVKPLQSKIGRWILLLIGGGLLGIIKQTF